MNGRIAQKRKQVKSIRSDNSRAMFDYPKRCGRALHSLLYRRPQPHSRGLRPLYCAPIMGQWRSWTKRAQWRGPYFRSDEILCARSADPLIVHSFEAKSLALSQAGHFCAFNGTYIDHINATVVRLDKTIPLRDIEPSYGSSSHSRTPTNKIISSQIGGGRALIWVNGRVRRLRRFATAPWPKMS